MNTDNINLESLFNTLNISRDDVRSLLGLEPKFRDYAWTALGMLSAGLVVGAGAALLLAPKSGAKLRADISDSFEGRLDALEQRMRGLVDRASEASEDSEHAQREPARGDDVDAMDDADVEDGDEVESEAKAA